MMADPTRISTQSDPLNAPMANQPGEEAMGFKVPQAKVGGAGGGPYSRCRGEGWSRRRLERMKRLAYKERKRLRWHKIVIDIVTGEDQCQLLNSMQADLCQSLQPVEVFREGSKAVLYIESRLVSSEITDIVVGIIPVGCGKMVNVTVRPCLIPIATVPNLALSSELQEKIKNAMSRRYDVKTHSLDLKRFHLDAALVSDNYVPLNRHNVAAHIIIAIRRNYRKMEALDLSENRLTDLTPFSQLRINAPKLKILLLAQNNLQDVRELNVLFSHRMVELSLDSNPLCDKFKDGASYVHAVTKRFPNLLRLDGVDLPSRGNGHDSPNSQGCPVQTGELSTAAAASCSFVPHPPGGDTEPPSASRSVEWYSNMVDLFMLETGLKAKIALKWLKHFQWRYQEASDFFEEFKKEGRIPQENFYH